MRQLAAISMLTTLLAGAGCSTSGMRTAPCSFGDATVKVELAETEGQRQRGLMYRDKLKSNRGMLFLYPDEVVRSFWMKNTFVPLSIAFMDADWEIVHITDMQPRSLDSHSSIHRCRYVLEVNRGWFDDHGVESGDVLQCDLPAPEE